MKRFAHALVFLGMVVRPLAAQDILVNAPITITPGGLVTVAVEGAPGHPLDWITLAHVDDPDTTYGAWTYLPAFATTITFAVPTTGFGFEFRWFADNGYTRRKTSPTLYAAAAPIPTVGMLTAGTVTVSTGQRIVLPRPADYAQWTVTYDPAVLEMLTPADEVATPGAAGWRLQAIGTGSTALTATTVFTMPVHPPPPYWTVTVQVQ